MSNIPKYKNTLVLLSIVISCLFVGYYFLFRDLVQKNTHIAQLLNQIDSESDKEFYASQIKKQMASLDTDIKKVQNTVVASDGVVNFIEQLEKIARNNGITIKNNSISEDADSKLSTSTTFLKIRSETSGSWVGTYKFIYELESLPYKVSINTFNLSTEGISEDSVSGTGNWNAVFEIKLLKYI